MSDIAIVQVSFGDPAEAAHVARVLVDERLVACATVSNGTSVYRWDGAVEQSEEVIVAFKTTIDLAARAGARIAALHSYDLPVIESWPVSVAEEVAAWVHDSTG